jgi:tetratricopeptide (TPR) repeat protein
VTRRRRGPRRSRPGTGQTGGNYVGHVSGTAGLTQVAGDQFNVVQQLVVHATQIAGGDPLGIARPTDRIWNIPDPVRSFTGRELELEEITSKLAHFAADGVVPAAAVCGIGGVGKSQIALAYAANHSSDYRIGWWIPAETELDIITGLASLGEALGLRGPAIELARAAIDALRGESGWLVIFDNATPEVLIPFLPRLGKGAIVITSRYPAWPGIAQAFHVDVLPLETATELVLTRSGRTDREAAKALAIELGCLPLALEQAASYIAGPPSMSVAFYLKLILERRNELLKLGKPVPYGNTVDATFSLALNRLRRSSPASLQLLELFAFFAPEGIPTGLLLTQPESPGDSSSYSTNLRAAIGHLGEAGLLSEERADTMRMHRLVQAVVRAHMADNERRKMITRAVDLLFHLTPDPDDPRTWPTAKLLFPHAQAALGHADDEKLATESILRLASKTGLVASWVGLGLDVATQIDSFALDVARRGNHGDAAVAMALNNLGKDYHLAGRLREARDHYEQSLAIRRRLFPGDNEDVALTLDNLASVLRDTDELTKSREFDEEALAMRQRMFQGDHAFVAQSLGSLATDHFLAREYDLGLPLRAEALAMTRRIHVGDHPDVATSLGNYAIDLAKAGQSREAIPLLEQALAMRLRLFPGDNSDVAQSLNSLAAVWQFLGDHEKSVELQQRALEMLQRLHPGDHRHVALALHNYAVDLHDAGEFERAKQLDDESEAMLQRIQESVG